ncbi:glycoside hydrolase family 28 protein [Sulfobacillus harzensis]|uniref:Glycoside hydrolase n=1 Tax=Sulfobacillus harzensis TaxID=2729629 RepID=A0A7Y0L6B2_9FIRM|nr:glycosyl hydrolase family 28 protein [Sulfobacillus harzensis]NMP23833.1 glycoside hydrolase [Sulfobacillus harzensis]
MKALRKISLGKLGLLASASVGLVLAGLAGDASAQSRAQSPAPSVWANPLGLQLHLTPLTPYLQNLPFARPTIYYPSIPGRLFNIVKYGAQSNALSTGAIAANTKAINNAIQAASQAGGGEVVIPAGLWITGPIVMKSNVNLHADRGAIVQFTDDHSFYPLISRFGQKSYQSPIYAVGVKNIAITGRGEFNGAGNTWNAVKKNYVTATQWTTLVNSGGVVQNGSMWWPSEQIMNDHNLIPFMVFVLNDQNVLIDGPTFENSPTEAFYLNYSTNVIVGNTKVLNPWDTQNTVGVDVSNDQDVLMFHDTINTGDDDIALNSSPSSSADALKNILIENSNLYNGHGGIAVGSYTSGGIKNVYVNNINEVGTEDGIRFKSAVGRGGLVHDFYLDNIHMRNIQNYAITFNSNYGNKSPASGTLSSLKYVPQFENIQINNVVDDYAGVALRIQGLSYAPVKDITLTNVHFKSVQKYSLQNAQNITMNNVTWVYGKELGMLYHYGVGGQDFSNPA